MARPPIDQVVADLAGVVGAAHVVTDPDVAAPHTVDWTGRFRGATAAVVRPGSVDEVAEVVARCRAARVALVPQGGNTGLVGGGVPLDGEVVLSLARLGAVRDLDATAMQATAEAGVTVAHLQGAATAAGLAYAVDLGSRDTATVGGTVATNAGGLRFLRWGGTRQQLLGVEAVLGDGSVVRHLGGLAKDNTGYDLAGLLCGSEGTLGVVTAARLRLVPALPERVVALVAFPEVGAAVHVAAAVRARLPTLEAAELMVGAGMALVCEQEGLAPPFPSPHRAYLLLEAADQVDPTPALAAALERAGAASAEAAVASDERGRAGLWAYRERHTLAVNALGPPHKLDVTLPIGALAAFVEEVPGVVTALAPGARTWLFGHVGDGNVHVNVTGLDPGDDRVDGAVLRLVAARGGSISAEHGIGRAKLGWLHLSRTPAEVAAFRAVKGALDPDGILNPGVLVPPAGPPATAPGPPGPP